MTSFAESVAHAVLRVTKPWAEIKKQQDREQRQAAAYRRDRYFAGSLRVTIRDVAFQAIPQAYQKASGNGEYPATARQIMYAARPAIQEKTGRRLLVKTSDPRTKAKQAGRRAGAGSPNHLRPGGTSWRSGLSAIACASA